MKGWFVILLWMFFMGYGYSNYREGWNSGYQAGRGDIAVIKTCTIY